MLPWARLGPCRWPEARRSDSAAVRTEVRCPSVPLCRTQAIEGIGARMSEERFDCLIRDAEHAAFFGWDFSWLRGRMTEEPCSWDYAAMVRQALAGAA